MTTIFWPSDLPQAVDVGGFGVSPGEGRLRTPVEAGLARLRRRWSAVADTFNCGVSVLTFDQTLRLERFWREDLSFGVNPFLLPSPLSDGNVLTDESADPLTDENDSLILIDDWWRVRFVDPYKLSAQDSIYFQAQLPLERVP